MPRIDNHCLKCGQSNGAKGDFCPRCGWKYSDPIVSTPAPTPVPTPAPAVVSSNPNQPVPAPAATNPKGGSFMKKVVNIILVIFGIIFLIGLIMGSGWFIRGCTFNNNVVSETIPAVDVTAVETTTAAVPTDNTATTAAAVDNAGATVPAETTAASTDVAFKPEVAKGETISANKEFQVQAGDVVSGDIYYVTADDVAVPIMDDDSTTALITYFTEGARLRTGDTWSVYLVHQPSQTEIDNLIAEKQKENFERVDYILFPATQAESSK